MTAESAQTPAQLPQDDQAYLQQLGARVRDARTRHGLSRKALAAKSGVSERYLAQLESGQGNISILLLRQVAAALDTPLTELLGERDGHPIELTLLVQYLEKLSPKKLIQAKAILSSAFGEQDPLERRHRIALIGLRGAGKSTLGKGLAEHLGVSFIELDDEIEREAGVPSSEIFSLYGQNAYRRHEKRCLERIIEHHEHVVIAAGGGLVSEAPTYELLRNACFTVWIKASPEEHMQRVIAQGDLRPMTGREEAMADLRRILAERNELYGLADAIIDTSNKTVDASQEELQNMYNISS
ncbi:MAG: helix-turn-helix transcriptional regulator [Burkholderiales bacterium]|jgi:XRE family aerobic/anaerobic benzoate catabolism transcriptional regulator|uniref:Shikimate kinase n=1 Tax=Candidatus Desulfobacillus denitrificans TaxID=2608985 RepID=A0A809R3E2_9PROT|nr:helix-turn-helix transcriptional regulator [Zoogloeaceae bacterium]MBP9654848.1 helix-turn-helix transcriptional regulator [Rhodocyclaceae bacterium]MCZ2173797.1 helix-turn-helix transcriptional regulator [Burkholderiales bacterium]BBO21238.1 helix-turn-helix domain-containing protein [Candidatus Desulfobacillus denitrificans]GIK46495.1 MAG: shikimate kinase [Betaproteobacteria bacterium]